jgi:hypothetical protein
MMSKWKEIADKLNGDEYNIYSNTNLSSYSFPAIILKPISQTPQITTTRNRGRMLSFNWEMILIDNLDNYDSIEECMDSIWLLSETIPELCDLYIIEYLPFENVMENNKILGITLRVSNNN